MVLPLIRHARASFGTADYDRLSEFGVRQAIALDGERRRQGVRPARIGTGSARGQEQTAMLCSCTGVGARRVHSGFDEYLIDEVLAHLGATNLRLEQPGVLSTREFQARSTAR